MIEKLIKDVPADWEIVKLNSLLNLLTDFESNGSFASVKENVTIYNSANFAWYVRATDLQNNKKLNEVKYVDESSYKFLKKTTLHGGELLITKRGEIGKLYFFEKKTNIPCTLAPNLYLLKLNEKVEGKYLYYFYKSNLGNSTLKRINASTTLGALYKDDVKKLKVPLPPLPEQKKIVTIFNAVDEKIATITTKIQATESLKKGLMQRLLTQGIGHTKFKESKLGRIPESWEVIRLNEICDEIFLGLTSKVDYVEEGGYPFIRATDINTGRLLFDKVRFISEKQHKKLTSRRLTKRGDVLVSKSGTLGTCAIVDVDTEFSTYESIITIQPKANILFNEFLLQILQDVNVQKRMIGARVGGIVGHLNLMTFRKLIIPLPSYEEQQEISKSLSLVDEKVVFLKEKRAAYQDLKKGLMQQLLTGKIRVKIPTNA